MPLSFAPPVPAESTLTRLDPRAKLVACAISIGLVAAMSTVEAAGLALAGSAGLVLVAQLPGRWLVRRAAALTLAMAPFAILMPVLQGWDGANLAAILSFKAFAIAGLAMVVIGTAPLPATARAAASLGVPRRLVEIGLLSYRYLFVMGDEFLRLRTALHVRGFRARTNAHTYRTMGQALGTLVVRGASRAERVSQALRCRGSNGRFPVLDERRFGWIDAAFVVATIAYFATLLIFVR